MFLERLEGFEAIRCFSLQQFKVLSYVYVQGLSRSWDCGLQHITISDTCRLASWINCYSVRFTATARSLLCANWEVSILCVAT